MSVDFLDYTPSKVYRPKGLTPAQVLFCEAYMAGETPHKSAIIAGYKNPSRASGYLLNCKRIKAYLNKVLPTKVSVSITFDSKLESLKELIDCSVDKYTKDHTPSHAGVAMKAIEIANTMQGHNAPTQTQAVTVNVKATQDKLLEAKKAYDEY